MTAASDSGVIDRELVSSALICDLADAEKGAITRRVIVGGPEAAHSTFGACAQPLFRARLQSQISGGICLHPFSVLHVPSRRWRVDGPSDSAPFRAFCARWPQQSEWSATASRSSPEAARARPELRHSSRRIRQTRGEQPRRPDVHFRFRAGGMRSLWYDRGADRSTHPAYVFRTRLPRYDTKPLVRHPAALVRRYRIKPVGPPPLAGRRPRLGLESWPRAGPPSTTLRRYAPRLPQTRRGRERGPGPTPRPGR